MTQTNGKPDLEPVDIAMQFVGTNNRSIFNDWFYGTKGILTAYCGTLVSYCYAMAGFQLPVIGYTRGFASVPLAVEYFRKNNLLVKVPARNDIVFYDWTCGRNPLDIHAFKHTGLFLEDCGDGIHFMAVEGNTSNPNEPNTGGESNGGWVIEKKRAYATAIFGRPVKHVQNA